MRRLFLLLLLAPALTTCKKENACDCFKGTGGIVTEDRQPGSFRDVFVEDNVNLIFVEDTVTFLRVEAGEHLVRLVKTDVSDGWLRIRNDNKCNFVRRYDIPINVYVHYKRTGIFHIKTRGTGTITNANPCTADSIDLDVESSGDIRFVMGNGTVYTHQHGAGDITLSGTADQVIIYSIGTGFTITDSCTNFYTWVYTNTTGKITVCPTNYLVSEIAGSGNVYYRGSPANITNTEHSTGKLLPLP